MGAGRSQFVITFRGILIPLTLYHSTSPLDRHRIWSVVFFYTGLRMTNAGMTDTSAEEAKSGREKNVKFKTEESINEGEIDFHTAISDTVERDCKKT